MNLTSAVTYKSPLHEMTQSTPTSLWNDSASIPELTYSIDFADFRRAMGEEALAIREFDAFVGRRAARFANLSLPVMI